MPAEAVLGERLSNHIQYLQLGKEPSHRPGGENIILFLNSERLKDLTKYQLVFVLRIHSVNVLRVGLFFKEVVVTKMKTEGFVRSVITLRNNSWGQCHDHLFLDILVSNEMDN